MIDYEPRAWLRLLLDPRSLRPFILPVLVVSLWGALVAHFHKHPYDLSCSDKAHALIGIALGLLLVFRTNASYDRFWEARKMWGAIVNETRNLGRSASVLLRDDPELVRRLLRWTTAFGWSTMHFLREEKGLGASASALPEDERRACLESPCPPLAVAARVSAVLAEARRRELISDYVQMTLDQNAQLLIDYMGACQRIRRTPLPFAYVVHLRRSVVLYCATLPFALVEQFGWLTPFVCFVTAFFLVGIEDIGIEIEDPFGTDPNDLPLEKICSVIEADLNAIEASLPATSAARP